MGRIRSLTNKSLLWFIGCTIFILLICTPLFYFLTHHYYAEEMIDLIESIQNGDKIPTSDLEEDIMIGIMIQFGLIILILSVASIVTMRIISQRLWHPFYDTMQKTKNFNIEKDDIPKFMKTDIQEFIMLHSYLNELMKRNQDSFRHQKEFTQNASHELQTPLAVIQSKLDLLLQEDLSEHQMYILQDMYSTCRDMARLNRNLLLLAKIDNKQFVIEDNINIMLILRKNIDTYLQLYKNVDIHLTEDNNCFITANEGLFQIMTNNLILNAIRHSMPKTTINISFSSLQFQISNYASGPELDKEHLFDRFNQSSFTIKKGNGIGLSIVKAICLFHNWDINYSFTENRHQFKVIFHQ